MAQKTQSSSLKKILIFGLPVIAILFLMPSGQPQKGTHKTVPAGTATKKTAKKGDIVTQEDIDARPSDFKAVTASMKNTFVPLVVKGGGKAGPEDLPLTFTQGESGWRYTGNMTVDGVPNALFENANSGDGAFIKPGQHWKGLRLVTVRDDSIVIEGPNGESKTVNFNENTTVSSAAASSLAPLPVAVPANQGNNPGNAQPGGRRQRGNTQFAQDDGSMNGPIGAGFTNDTSGQLQDNNNFGNGNRRNRNRRNNENSFN